MRATGFRCAVLVATLCNGAPALSQTIEVGLVAPLTGPAAPYGNQVRRGAEVAVEEINAKGGVLGRKLLLKTLDDGCEQTRAMQAGNIFALQDKAVAVIGHLCGPASFAAAPIYAQAGVPMMTLAPADRRLTDAAATNGWRNIFLMAGNVETQGFAAGTYLARRYREDGIALVSDQSSYGAGLADGFREALSDLNISPRFETSLTGNVDVVPTVERLRAAKPAAVYLAMTFANAGAVVKRAKETGLETRFVSGNSAGRREFLEIAGRASEGVLSTSLPQARPSPAAAEAIERLRRSGSAPEGYTLYAYAAVQVVAQAIERAASTEFNAMEPVLRGQSFPTVIGDVKFDEAGDRAVSEVSFSEWRNGNATPFSATDYWDVSRDAISMALPTGSPRGQGWGRPVLINPGNNRPTFEAKALQGVFWNTYFTRENEPDAKLSTQSQASYTLVLDLSAYNYRQIRETNAAGTAVDPRVKSALERAPQEPVELKIRPVVVTPLVTIEDVPVKSMRIDRKKLARPQEGAAAAQENRLVARFRDGAMTLTDFSAAVAAGQVSFQIKVADNAAPGCAVIAFTIWDFRDNPIDSLLQTVPVGDGTTQPNCALMNPDALKGGFATLLNPVFSLGSANPHDPIQAALHLFQIMAQGQKKTIAIFVDKTHYQPPQPGQPASEQGVFGWQTSQWLSDYIGDPNGLPAKISNAWNAAGNGTPSPYAGVADELAGQIFGASAADQPKADAAREALRKLAASQDRPVVVIRMVDENNRKLYVPFNLISGSGNTEGLHAPITVVQPLQTERYEAPSCIGKWAFALSKDTRDLDANVKNDIGALEADRSTGETWIRNAAELKAYFQATAAAPASAAPATPVPAEGLLLLAHHDQFGIFFDDVNGRVVAQGLRHTYPPGSIAVLAACGTARPNSGMDILNSLNDDGVDAMIVSPFNVRLDYGSRMALEFAKIVRENRLNKRTPTLAEMFAQATGATVKFFKDSKKQNSNARLEDMALEFILAGNPYLSLCSP